MAELTLEYVRRVVESNPAAAGATVLAVVVAFWVVRTLFPSKKEVFLDPQQFKPLPLVKIEQITHNTKRFVFALPKKNMLIGLPTGKHITFFAKDGDGKDVYRPYTPVTDDDTPGSVEFVIKLYAAGKMSQILAGMSVGDTMLMKGPRGRFSYGRNMKRAIGMLAGGTGITPMYQVALSILKDPRDTTTISLVFGNLSEEDILLRQELEDLVAAHPKRFRLYHVLNNPPGEGWAGGSGFITRDVISQRLPPPGPDVMVLRCGPPAMNAALKVQLDALGYPEDAQFEF